MKLYEIDGAIYRLQVKHNTSLAVDRWHHWTRF